MERDKEDLLRQFLLHISIDLYARRRIQRHAPLGQIRIDQGIMYPAIVLAPGELGAGNLAAIEVYEVEIVVQASTKVAPDRKIILAGGQDAAAGIVVEEDVWGIGVDLECDA